jgi:glycosyltransferase involved in cell wall biosynthesis
MRIAYICADRGVPVFGWKGSSVHVREVIGAMLAAGAEVDLFASRCEGKRPPRWENVRLHRLPINTDEDLAAQERASLATNEQLAALLQRTGPFDLVYERYSLWSHASMEYAQEVDCPGLLEVNAPLIEEQARHRGLVDRAAAEHVAERAFASATALLAVSDEVAAHLRQFPMIQDRVHVIPNGVNPDRFPPGLPASRPAAAGIFTVGFVGTLKPWHGLENLVESFSLFQRRVPESRLLIVGDGPGRKQLQADAKARGLRKVVEFTGAVCPEEIPALLASMDVGVAPYPKMDGFYFSPLKVFEYMAAGLPVVASRIGGLTNLIRHEENGLHCPPGDATALADALMRLQVDRPLRDRLGRQARAAVMRHHTWTAVVRRIFQLAGLAGIKPQLAEVH